MQTLLIERAMRELVLEPKAIAVAVGVSPTKFNQSVLPALRKIRCLLRRYPLPTLFLLILMVIQEEQETETLLGH